jgi:hypothetical protein
MKVLGTLKEMLTSDERRCLTLLVGVQTLLVREKDLQARERVYREAAVIIKDEIGFGKEPEARRAALLTCGFMGLIEMVDDLRRIASDEHEPARVREAAQKALDRMAAQVSGK